jgi:hypothetical protein
VTKVFSTFDENESNIPNLFYCAEAVGNLNASLMCVLCAFSHYLIERKACVGAHLIIGGRLICARGVLGADICRFAQPNEIGSF